MNFFERKERYKSGQNPIPTQEEFERNMEKVGDKWWPNGMVSGHDVYYDEPKEKPSPLIPLSKRITIDGTTFGKTTNPERIILESRMLKIEQIKFSINKILPKLNYSEVDELYSLLLRFATRIKEEER